MTDRGLTVFVGMVLLVALVTFKWLAPPDEVRGLLGAENDELNSLVEEVGRLRVDIQTLERRVEVLREMWNEEHPGKRIMFMAEGGE